MAEQCWNTGRGLCPPLFLAAMQGAPRSVIDLLVVKGAGVGWADYGETTLHMAAHFDHAEVVRALGGTHGAELDARTPSSGQQKRS